MSFLLSINGWIIDSANLHNAAHLEQTARNISQKYSSKMMSDRRDLMDVKPRMDCGIQLYPHCVKCVNMEV